MSQMPLEAKKSGGKGRSHTREGRTPHRNRRLIKITPASPRGDGKSAEGYHFTVENTSADRCDPSPSRHRTTILEFSCLDAESRDSWVQKIRESYHHGVVDQ